MSITITTNPVTNIIRNSATLNGTASGIPSGSEYKVWFEYSKSFYKLSENFEDWLSGDILPNWSIPSGTDYYKEETIVQNGTYSLKIIPDGLTQIVRTLIEDVIPYRGKFLRFFAYVRSNVINDANIGFSVNEGEIIHGNNGSTLDDLVMVCGKIAIPSNATGHLNINLYCGETPQSGGVAYYDNIRLQITDTDIETSEQLITIDSSFEANITNLSSAQKYWFKAKVKENISGSPEIRGILLYFNSAFYACFSTDLRTKILKVYQYLTNLVTNIRTIKKFATKLYTKAINYNKFSTDLRTKVVDYDLIQPGTLNDFIVKLDGTELTDVDYSTLSITYNRNSTPSVATFVLGRYHDKLNYKLDNIPSEITEENKIEIYDKDDKIFTGYITQINANSNTETVNITAEDCRYKMSKISMELWYGGGYKLKEYTWRVFPYLEWYTGNLQTKYEKNIGTAVSEIVTAISGLISGYDTLTFANSFVPEYIETYNDCASLLTELITNSANAGWYIDANEKLKYYKVGQGNIKTLSLSSVDSRRHIYDVIVDNIILNKKLDSYCQSYNVKLGKEIIRRYSRFAYEFSGSVYDLWVDVVSKYEFSLFCFQRTIAYPSSFIYGSYVGQRWASIVPGTTTVIQYIIEHSEEDLTDIVVGSGEPKKTLSLTNYSKKTENIRWEQKTGAEILEGSKFRTFWYRGRPVDYNRIIKESDIFLAEIQPEVYDYSAYAQELAEFNLSQVNTLTTQSTVTLLLDAYKYYNIGLDNRINLNNTLQSNIYNNANSFPLNIDSVTINCANRVVTLNLTNFGQQWCERTSNYLANYIPEKILSIQYRFPLIIGEFAG